MEPFLVVKVWSHHVLYLSAVFSVFLAFFILSSAIIPFSFSRRIQDALRVIKSTSILFELHMMLQVFQ